MGWKTSFSDAVGVTAPCFFLVLALLLILAEPPLAVATDRDPACSLRVPDRAVCRHMSGLKCLDSNTHFPSDVGRLYCLTRIVGAAHPTFITHVWYHGAMKRSRVRLAVKSANWRTYSSKTLPSQETGEWRVEILGPKEELLEVCRFDIGPVSGTTKKMGVPPRNVTDASIHLTQEKRSPRIAERALSKPVKRPAPKTTRWGRPTPDRYMTRFKAKRVIGPKIELQIGEKRTDTVHVDLNHYTTPVVLVLDGEIPKVAVHMMNVSNWDGPSKVPVNGRAVRQVRSRLDHTSNMLRILLDLEPAADYDVRSYSKTTGIYCIEISKR